MGTRLRRVLAIVLRQLYLIRGSVSRILPLCVWVGVDMVLWGFITKYLNLVTSPGFDFVPVLLGAVLLWDFFGRVMHGVTTAFFEDVWSRNFLNVFSTPVSVGEYVTGLVLTSIATSSVGLAVMLFLATTVFGLPLLSYGMGIAGFLLVLFLFGLALGIFGSAVVLRLGPASEWFIWPIPGLISPFAGVFYPLSVLPGWMQLVSRVLPPSYVFEALRALVAGQPPPERALVWGGGLSVAYLLLACWFFGGVYRSAVRTGLLARYSAESVS